MKNKSTFTILGFLMLAAIIAHYLKGDANDEFLHFWLYSWVFPMLVAMVGYMMDMKRIGDRRKCSLVQVAKLYWTNGMRDFMVGWLAFSLIDIASQEPDILVGKYTLENIVLHIIYPYFHLWLILSTFIMAFFNIILYRNNIRGWYLLAVNTVLGLLLEGLNAIIVNNPQPPFLIELPLFVNGGFMMFFGVGVACNENLFVMPRLNRLWSVATPLLVVASGLALLALLYIPLKDMGLTSWRYILTYPFLAAMFVWGLSPLMHANRLPMQGLSTVNAIGHSQRSIYIWHVIPLVVIRIIDNEVSIDNTVYYTVFVLLFAAFLLLYWRMHMPEQL